jgi:hypothetical protein
MCFPVEFLTDQHPNRPFTVFRPLTADTTEPTAWNFLEFLEEDAKAVADDDENDVTNPIMDWALQKLCSLTGTLFVSTQFCNAAFWESLPSIPRGTPHVQFHQSGGHWISTYTDGEHVYYVDSLRAEPDDYFRNQMLTLYRNYIEDNKLKWIARLVPIQPNEVDCGLFTIAYAFEYVHGNNPAQINPTVDEIRDHLYYCVTEDTLQRFPYTRVADPEEDEEFEFVI